MKIATSILICSAIVQCYPNSVDKRSSSNDAKSDGIWIDSNYVSKNQNIINPSIAEGVCKFIKNCISSDMGAFNHMALPLNKNGGDFEIKVDSFGRYSGATTYYGVPEPGFDKYFRKEIIFKSNYINSELHGTYKIDSNENITVFRILAQKLPDTYREITSKNGKSYTPPIKIISKPGSLIPLSSRKLEQVQNAIIIDSANFIRTSNAS